MKKRNKIAERMKREKISKTVIIKMLLIYNGMIRESKEIFKIRPHSSIIWRTILQKFRKK